MDFPHREPTVRRAFADGGASWWTTAALASCALGLFLALPQHTLHGVDGDQFVVWIEQGRHDYPRHVAYLHIAGAIFACLQPFGVSAFHALLLASALGSALAVLCLHRAFVLLTPATVAPAVAPTVAALATAPCFFYATCAEIHGVFVAGAGAAWWAFARFLRQPGSGRAALVGIAGGAAASVHAFGYLLLPMFAAAALVLRSVSWRWRSAGLSLATAAGGHLAIAALTSWWFTHGVDGQARDITLFVVRQWQEFAPATAPDVLVREWLLPFAPWSLLSLAGLFVARSRPWALVALVGVVLHLPVTTLLLGYHRIDEGGAYHLALVLPAIVSSLLLLRGGWFWLAVVASGALALATAMPEWPAPTDPAFVQGVAELQAERPMGLIVSRQELEGVRTGVRDAIAIDLAAALELYLEEKQRGYDLPSWFDLWFDQFDQHGRPLLLSARVCDYFAATADPEVRAFWDRHVPQRYAVVPVARVGFRGAWLVRAGR